MRCREAKPAQARNRVHEAEQVGEIEIPVAIGVDRLPEQHHLGVPALDQPRHLAHDLRGRPIHLGAAGPRHDAEAADVVTTLHGRDVGADRARVRDRDVGHRKRVRLAIEVDERRLAIGRAQQRGHTVERVRAHEHVHLGGPLQDLLALELGDAAPHTDPQVGPLALGLLEPGQRVVELAGSLLADGAGVDEHKVRGGQVAHGLVAFRRKQAGNLLRIVDVHLTAERPNEEARFLFRHQ